jgi:hypothetical protein
MSASPEGENLTAFDRVHINNFYKLWSDVSPTRCAPVFFASQLGSHVGVPLHNPGAISHNSTVFRFAISVIMSHLTNAYSSDTHVYLRTYYEEARRCINESSLLEVVFASYVVAMYSIIGGASIKMAINTCSQFSSAVVHLVRSNKDVDFEWIELLWQNVLSSLYYVHLDSILFSDQQKPEELASSIRDRQQLISQSHSLLPTESDISRLPLSMTTEMILHKIRTLSIHLQFQCDHFLFQAIVDRETTPPISESLDSILSRIIELIPRLSNISDYIYHTYSTKLSAYDDSLPTGFLDYQHVHARGLKPEPKERDTALAILYVFARLLKNMLEPKLDSAAVSTDLSQSAIALCRLCASFSSPLTPMATLLIKRTLFWARMGLVGSTFSLGRFPMFSKPVNSCSSTVDSRHDETVHSHWLPLAAASIY